MDSSIYGKPFPFLWNLHSQRGWDNTVFATLIPNLACNELVKYLTSVHVMEVGKLLLVLVDGAREQI